MNKKSNNKGFTLVELLVAISILGLITVMALPQISHLQNQNKETKYKKYAETLMTSGKLYTDSYAEDMFGYNTSGCVDISYNELYEKNLLKDLKVDGATCKSDDTFVRVRKTNNNYTYEVSIYCTGKSGEVLYDERIDGSGCESSEPDNEGPTITFSQNGHDWTTETEHTTKIQIYDEYGMLENTKIKYIWSREGYHVGSFKEYEFKNNRYEGTPDAPLETPEIEVPYSTTGRYSLVVTPVNVRDANGNYRSERSLSSNFNIDTTPPRCAIISNENSTWTSRTLTITITCSDGIRNGSNSTCVQSTYSKRYSSGKTQTDSMVIKDKAGNQTTCTYDVYVDKT